MKKEITVKQYVYVVVENGTIDNEQFETVGAFETLEKARAEKDFIQREIEDHFGKTEGYTFDEDENSFVAYEDGKYNENNWGVAIYKSEVM